MFQDSQLQQSGPAEFSWEPSVTAGHIGVIASALHRSWFFDPDRVHVSAVGGKVVLTGTVHSYFERQIAAQTA